MYVHVCVRALGARSRGAGGSAADPGVDRGAGLFVRFPARVTRENDDGTYAVKYDDGDVDNVVARSALEPRRGGGKSFGGGENAAAEPVSPAARRSTSPAARAERAARSIPLALGDAVDVLVLDPRRVAAVGSLLGRAARS